MKNLFITEKPSVAMEFSKALGVKGERKDGYLEDDKTIITWCVGHLVGMCYPEKYDPSYKQWSLETLPFLPENYLYEPLEDTKKQYKIVASLLNRKDIGCIYYSGDSAREGEYIQRLIRQLAGHNPNAEEKRVWIDSQTYEEIRRGIREAKPLSDYDLLSDAAYARAIEDFAIGINFSRAITLRYSKQAAAASGQDKAVIAVGRVMSCVLGMTVRREREIRNHVKTEYFGVEAEIENGVSAAWRPKKGSPLYSDSELYYSEEKKGEGERALGFVNSALASKFISSMPQGLLLKEAEFKKTKKAAPLLFNLAELQGECTRRFKMSPSDTLAAAQTLYEKKLTTYPRTDARVITKAVAKEVDKNIRGLSSIPDYAPFVSNILSSGSWQKIGNTRYCDDSKVSDHYAIIPTGNTAALQSISGRDRDVYDLICRRFLSVFYPAAEYEKMSALFSGNGEDFTCGGEALISQGWLEIAGGQKPAPSPALEAVRKMKEGGVYDAEYEIKARETKPPARYTTGSMILAMENAGRLIEDEDLREQIKGCGIGTSATRAETIKKLIKNGYIQSDKSQVISPTLLGEVIYETLDLCAPQVLSPDITANWEKGLSQIEHGQITKEKYVATMNRFVSKNVNAIKESDFADELDKRTRPLQGVYGVKAKKESSSGKANAPGTCPKCGRKVNRIENGKYAGSYVCSDKNCTFRLWNTYAGKKLSEKSMQALLLRGETDGKVKNLTAKSGKKYDAKLVLDENFKIKPKFD